MAEDGKGRGEAPEHKMAAETKHESTRGGKAAQKETEKGTDRGGGPPGP